MFDVNDQLLEERSRGGVVTMGRQKELRTAGQLGVDERPILAVGSSCLVVPPLCLISLNAHSIHGPCRAISSRSCHRHDYDDITTTPTPRVCSDASTPRISASTSSIPSSLSIPSAAYDTTVLDASPLSSKLSSSPSVHLSSLLTLLSYFTCTTCKRTRRRPLTHDEDFPPHNPLSFPQDASH